MTRIKVLGLDLSLTCTGVADPDGITRRIRPGARRDATRLAWIRQQLSVDLDGGIDLAAIEGYSFGSRSSQAHSLGELGGVIRTHLHDQGVAYIAVPPATLKTYATGKGNAGKTAVIIAARDRLGYPGTDDNEADALWLWAFGLDLAGQPPIQLPQLHRRALDKITLP